MRRGRGTAFVALAVLALAFARAESFPLGFSVVGGIGYGYYDMEALNTHLGHVAQERNVKFDGLTGGVNFRIEGRAWAYGLVAATGGFEHFWGETESEGTSSTLSYRAPCDVYTVGAIIAAIKIENAMNLCAGANVCFAHAVYGTNEEIARRFSEFKGENEGYEIYAEAHTNFMKPIEVGFQLGYRGLVIKEFTDKYGNVAPFEPDIKMELDYSGAFFYFTTAIRL
jgi:hypothetical protein